MWTLLELLSPVFKLMDEALSQPSCWKTIAPENGVPFPPVILALSNQEADFNLHHLHPSGVVSIVSNMSDRGGLSLAIGKAGRARTVMNNIMMTE
uniref:Putative secreted protein n=1 Tax=Anopheles darlingi TaxID=43151 RepID=A0A2M4DC39_ANODA